MANIARRLTLNIPIHLDESEHRFFDGYCQCGAAEKKTPRKVRLPGGAYQPPRPRVNLDIIEGNLEYM